jgi:hypothetical protein
VDEALLVGRLEGFRDLGGDMDRLGKRERPLLDHFAQGLPLNILHGEEEFALDLPDLVDAADIGMAQGRGGLGLAYESRPHRQVPIGRLGQELEGHLAVEGRILRQVDLAHAAPPELPEDRVLPGERLAGGPF